MRSDAPDYLKSLAPVVEQAPEPARAAARRREMARHIAASSRETKGRVAAERRQARWLGAMSSAAASLLLFWGWTALSPLDDLQPPSGSLQGSSTRAARASTNEPASIKIEEGRLLGLDQGSWGPGESVGKGTLRVGGKDAARLRLSGGASVRAGAGTRVRWRGDQASKGGWENLILEEGVLLLDVPPLKPHQRLTVQTAEAMVEVRGTAFEVRRSKVEGKPVTSVRVSEGLVQVSVAGADVLLAAGDEWTSHCRSMSAACAPAPQNTEPKVERASASARTSDPHSPVSRGAGQKTAQRTRDAEALPVELSELPEQNRLYQSALQAQRTGFDQLARTRFEALLARYPSSPLAAGARRELQRIDAKLPQP